MTHQPLPERMARLKVALEMLEHDAVAGDVPRDALEDFKAAIDHTRISLWAILTSPQSGGYRAVVAHFRFRRAIDLCQQVAADAQGGYGKDDEALLRRLDGALLDARRHVARQLRY
jgi:hypothetical protein